MKADWKRFSAYAGLPVLMCVYLAASWGHMEPVLLLMKEVLLVWGYLFAVEDWRSSRVPNRMLKWMLGAWVLLLIPQAILRWEIALFLLVSGAVGALLGGGIFLVMYLASRRGLGGGDVKFMTVVGLYLGALDILAVTLYGSVLVAVYGLTLVAQKKITLKDSVPMLPFLYIGIVARLFLQLVG